MDDVPDPEDGELEWNAAAYRVRYISKLTVAVRRADGEAFRHKDQEHIQRYYNFVRMLFKELHIYMEQADIDAEQIWSDLQDIGDAIHENERSAQAQLDRIEEIDMQLQEVRRDVGLDIPSKTKLDPESAALEGLVNG